MDVKPDPKPGRWILPIVILAMVGFTYIFVSSVDLTGGNGDDGDGVDIGATTSTTQPVIDTTLPEDEDDPDLDPDTAAYIERVEGFDDELQGLADEFVEANAAWDAGTATFAATGDRFRGLIGDLETWSGGVAASNPPPGLDELVAPHQAVKDAASAPLTHARAALAALQSNASGSAEDRRSAVADLETSAAEFSNAVTAAVAAAGG